MVEAPNPIMIQNNIVFKYKEKENAFTLTFSNESDTLGISISEEGSVPPINYSAKFTLSDLKELSRYFKLFGSIEELMPELKNLCDQNQVKISKEKDFLNLILSLPLKIVAEVNLPIPQDKVDSEKVIASLCQTVNDLNKKIKCLKRGEIPEEQLEENLKSKDILKNEDEKNMVINWILQENDDDDEEEEEEEIKNNAMKRKDKKVNMTLLYKLTSHGDGNFHSYCDNKGPTLTLIRNSKGYRCGGFTNQSWASRYTNYGGNANVSDPNAFLFSLEFKEKYPSYDGNNALYDCYNMGPCFGGGNDLNISGSCSSGNNSYCNFPYCYCGTRARALSGGAYNFKVNELEVYKIEII